QMLSSLKIEGFSALYLSSEVGLMKYYGEMFDHVLEKENIKPHEMLHIGDDEISDVKSPAKRGIATMRLHAPLDLFKSHLGTQRLYAKNFPDDNFPELPLFSTLSVGLTATRFFANPNHLPPPNGLFGGSPFHLGYSALGPAVSGFALWLGQMATCDKVANLFFLSRDGAALKDSFDVLAPQLWPHLKSHYLYNSRKVVLGATIDSPQDILTAVISYFKPVPLGRWLADKLGLDEKDVPRAVLRNFNIALNDEVSVKSRDLLLPLALALAPAIYAKSAARLRALKAYLNESGFSQNSPKAVGDVGFSCAIQAALAKAADDKNLGGYYFFTDYRAHRAQRDFSFKSFFPPFTDPFSNEFPHKYLYHCYFETLLKDGAEAALDDLTLNSKGRPQLIFKPQTTGARNREVAPQILAGAKAFAEDLAKHFGHHLKEISLNPHSACHVYLDFLSRPNPADALI
ncbi:MAG: hypothetical protein ACRCTY_07800, partial [Candidatus Adiutrix sp.]